MSADGRDARSVLLAFLASFRDPAKAAAMFAVDGVFELPYLVNTVAAAQALLPGGPAEIAIPDGVIKSY